jgi:hypothetical protein
MEFIAVILHQQKKNVLTLTPDDNAPTKTASADDISFEGRPSIFVFKVISTSRNDSKIRCIVRIDSPVSPYWASGPLALYIVTLA